jgi:hypothetical protein
MVQNNITVIKNVLMMQTKKNYCSSVVVSWHPYASTLCDAMP